MLLFESSNVLSALLLALVIDAVLGDPAWLYRRCRHPVAVVGELIQRLEARWLDPSAPPQSLRWRGMWTVLGLIVATVIVGWVVQWACTRWSQGWLLLGFLMSSLIAQRGLYQHVVAVADGLDRGLAHGRRAVAHIVGRDPDTLDRHGVARAAIESTAENFADGVVAPVLWAALLGLPGMLAYKTINTLDSMIGHRSDRYVHFGRFAARLDDAANWVPARLGAWLIALAAVLVPGARSIDGWRAMRRDASRHRSVNAGWPEAAMAGSLGLRLAGPRSYAGETVDDAWMGRGRAEATPTDILQGLRLFMVACCLLALLLVLALG